MAWKWNGTTGKVTCPIGASNANTASGYTLAMLMRPNALAAWMSMIDMRTSGNAPAISLERQGSAGGSPSNGLLLAHSTSVVNATLIDDLAAWYFVCTTWANGINGGIAQVYVSKNPTAGAAPAASSFNSSFPASPASQAGGTIVFGEYGGGGDWLNGWIAWAAIWPGVVMTALQVAECLTNLRTSDVWNNSIGQPSALWEFRGTVSNTAAVDLSGNGSTSTAVAGVTDDTGTVPTWTFDGTGASGDATVIAVPAACTGDSPDSVITGAGDMTQVSPAADGTGDVPIPTIAAGSVVTAVPATALGSAPIAGNEVSVEIGAPAATALDGTTAPAVTGTGGAEVVAVPADGTGSVPTTTLLADALITAAIADATGTSPAQTVSGELAALITAVPADAIGYAPAPLVSDGTVTDSPVLYLPTIPEIPEIPVLDAD